MVEFRKIDGFLKYTCWRRVFFDPRWNLVDPASSHMLVSMIKPCMRCVIFNTEQRSAHEGGGNFVGGHITRIIMTTSRLIRGEKAIHLLALLAILPHALA